MSRAPSHLWTLPHFVKAMTRFSVLGFFQRRGVPGLCAVSPKISAIWRRRYEASLWGLLNNALGLVRKQGGFRLLIQGYARWVWGPYPITALLVHSWTCLRALQHPPFQSAIHTGRKPAGAARLTRCACRPPPLLQAPSPRSPQDPWRPLAPASCPLWGACNVDSGWQLVPPFTRC